MSTMGNRTSNQDIIGAPPLHIKCNTQVQKMTKSSLTKKTIAVLDTVQE